MASQTLLKVEPSSTLTNPILNNVKIWLRLWTGGSDTQRVASFTSLKDENVFRARILDDVIQVDAELSNWISHMQTVAFKMRTLSAAMH